MRLWLTRAIVLGGLLALGLLLRGALAPRGLAWIVDLLGGALGLAIGAELLLRGIRRRRERASWARWRAAVLDATPRPAAIEELTRAAVDAERAGARGRRRRVRLALALGELLLADGRSEAATAQLARVPLGGLEPAAAVLLRLARAQAYLHRGDAEGARAALSAIEPTLADPVLDASARLARAGLALTEGDAASAREAASAVRARAREGDDLFAEACLIEAAAERLLGHDRGAEAALDRLDAPTRARALALGPAAAREALDG